MRVGLHVLGYDCAEYIDRFFAPWLEAKKNGLDLTISVGHVCFKEYQEFGFPVKSSDGSHERFQDFFTKRDIDYYQFLEERLSEAEARNKVLFPIKDKIDLLIISAPDEIFSVQEINGLLSFVTKNPLTDWFRIEYRNLTFSERTYTKGFAPPRVFRNGRKRINSFWNDDEIYFDCHGRKLSYLNLASQRIPTSLCNPLHYTWLDNQRSHVKCDYQHKRWGEHGCSFEVKDGILRFDPVHFANQGQTVPELHFVS